MNMLIKLILFVSFSVNCSNSQILIKSVKNILNPITSDLKVQFPDIKIPETFNPFNLTSFKGFDPFNTFDGKIFNPFQFDLEEIFKRFSENFNRNYTVDDIPQRKKNLLKSIKLIAKHIIDSTIGGQSSFNVGLTGLSDLSENEYRKLLGSKQALDSEKIIASRRRKRATSVCDSNTVSTSFPYAYDSRTKNIVTAVKSQNTNCQKVVTRQYRSGNSIITEYQTNCDSCGSCWAFATVATIETLWAKKTGQLIDLSEQDLVNCATSDGCNGAFQDTGYQYVKKNGIARESDVPYKAKSSECKHYPLVNGVQISDYCEKGGKLNYTSKYENGTWKLSILSHDPIPATDDEMIRDVLEMGSVATAINADDPLFRQYKSGIYDSSSCSIYTNHGVVVVGYGAENGKEYWIVKNSWDTTWGESGYIRVARNKNLCGINNRYNFPIITNTSVVNKLS